MQSAHEEAGVKHTAKQKQLGSPIEEPLKETRPLNERKTLRTGPDPAESADPLNSYHTTKTSTSKPRGMSYLHPANRDQNAPTTRDPLPPSEKETSEQYPRPWSAPQQRKHQHNPGPETQIDHQMYKVNDNFLTIS